MNGSTLATAADYADALLTARRAKRMLVAVIFAVLLAELTVFFVARYGPTALPTGDAGERSAVTMVLNYVLIAGGFLALLSAVALPAVLFVIVMIMVAGRLIGVGRVTGALVWAFVLVLLLFPWQSVFLSPASTPTGAPALTGDFRVPGVLYSWTEVIHPQLGARFAGELNEVAVLRWGRYVAGPVFALLVLMSISRSSARGLRQALGELPPATTTVGDPIST